MGLHGAFESVALGKFTFKEDVQLHRHEYPSHKKAIEIPPKEADTYNL